MAQVLLTTLFKGQKNYQVAPPLGLLTMGAALRRAGHDVRLLDLRARMEPFDRHLDVLRADPPDVVGFSAVILEAGVLRRAVAAVADALPGAKIVIGGPYANSSTDEVMALPQVDAVVLGEGEIVFEQLIAAWARGEERPALPGVGYPGHGAIPAPEPIADLDALPLPAWDLADFALYHRRPRHGYLYKHRAYFSVLTSRGCPYHCVFCQCIFGHQYRTRSAAAVIEEVEALVREHGVREIHFVDDAFNLDLDRAKAICDGIIARRLDIAITFPAGLRADRMDVELLDKLAAAGCFKIPYGIETASPRLQRLLKKNVRLDKLREIIDHTQRRGIITQGFFMLGFPTETEADVQQTIDFALRSKLHFATFNHVNVFPGTELWTMAAALGKTEGYDPATCDYDDPPLCLSEVPAARMKALTRRVHLAFYLSPRRLWRIWRALPRKRHFFGFFGLFVGKLFWFSTPRGDNECTK